MVDIFEVGTGGGSIAEIDIGGALRVGPKSAGADPGPACYGRGGMLPTVTDANLLLGRLHADHFLGGEMPLVFEAAAKAIDERIAQPLSIAQEAAAEGIIRIAVTKMSYAVKGVSTERGLDAAAFTMIAYGGAGPLHASAVAQEIGMRRVIIPMSPGHFCAFGMLHADLRYDLVKTWFRRLDDASFEDIKNIYESLVGEGQRSLAFSNTTPKETSVSYAADMRYVGQEHAVTLDLPNSFISVGDRAAIKRHFDEVHEHRYGTSAPLEPAEFVSLRATVAGSMVQPAMKRLNRGNGTPNTEALRPTRRVYFSEAAGFIDTVVFNRSNLLAGDVISGPALVEEHASTTVVLPGDTLHVDDLGNLVIAIGI